MRLGKLPPVIDPRTLKISKYLTELPEIPASRDWTTGMPPDFGMMGNDEIGDCTVAAAGHAIQVWTKNAGAGPEITIPDSEIIAAYSAVGGYDPKDPNSDNGLVALDLLKYWKNVGIGGHKIGAFVALNPKNILHVQAAIELFGGAYIGLAMPRTALAQTRDDVPWRLESPVSGDNAPGSWGGHAVFTPAFSHRFFDCITWAKRQLMSINYWWGCCDEAYGIVTLDFLNQSTGKSPDGFDLETLLADLVVVTG